jgi:hypothetical protein
MTRARSALADMLTAAGGLPRSPKPALPESNNDANESEKFYHGLDEVNLLEGLSLGTHIFPPFLLPTHHT